MGEQFIRDKNEADRRKREGAFGHQLATETLFSACPETFITVYRCRRIRVDIDLECGDPLLIVDDGDECLAVLKHNLKVGDVVRGDSRDLRKALATEGRLSGTCYAQVSEAVSPDETFTVIILPIGGEP